MSVSLSDHRRVHFVGIGGIGMSALARFLLEKGFEVSGSDRSPGDQGAALSDLGARVEEGHRAENIDEADLVVVTAAVTSDNVELHAAHERRIPVIKRAQLLAAVLNASRGVAVAGTHGKTTTSSLVGHILLEAGFDPTILVGGVSLNLGSNARVGGDLVVAEADEYDGSFLYLRPRVAVITNVEPDHLDFYGSAARIHEAFRTFAEGVQETLVVCADDPMASQLTRGVRARVCTYGIQAGDWRARDIAEHGSHTSFTVQHGNDAWQFTTTLAGVHNVSNIVAATIVGASLGAHSSEIQRAVAGFRGVARRLELRGEARGVLVLDDYAHHPTEIRAVLAAIKDRWKRPVRVVFQPHTFSRTSAFLDDFSRSFQQADAVYLMDIYAAREVNTYGVTGRELADATRTFHLNVRWTGTAEQTLEELRRDAQPGDVVVTMGAGDVTLLGPELLRRLRQ